MHTYSDFFKTLHDETAPVGYLGRGTHYSVLRCLTWHDQLMKPLSTASYHDFSIIWDEDHDIRIIPVIEELYTQNLLSPAIFIGERKGNLTIVLDDSTADALGERKLKEYSQQVDDFTQSLCGDPWPAYIEVISSAGGCIINADNESVLLYLRSIKMLWKLGLHTK